MSGIRVLALQGELDIARRDETRFALAVDGTENGILLDFSTVSYADSTILSTLLAFVGECDARGIPVAVLTGTPQFERIVQYAGLGEALPVFSDRSLALTHLSEGRR